MVAKLNLNIPLPVTPPAPDWREPDERYRELLEVLGVAVYRTDAAGRITFYNDAAAELWGRRPELGKDKWCGSWKLHRTDGTPMQHDECPMAITLKEMRPVRGAEAIAERPDGTRVHFMPIPSPIFDSSGNLIGAVNVLVDITEGKKAEAEAGRQRDLVATITKNMSTGLLMVDAQDRLEYMNPAAERITGFKFDDVRGESAHETLHHVYPDGQPYPASECTLNEATKLGEYIVDHQDVFVRQDGSRYDVICNLAPVIENGAHVGAIADLRDATEEKRAEETIRQSLAIKDQFLGLISHELRTPIATIMGNALLLLRRGEQLGEINKQQALVDVASEAEKLQRIIENLLLLARVEAGQRMEGEAFRLPPLIDQAIATFRRRNPGREIKLIAEKQAPIVNGQPGGLDLVLANLISNADKYSPPGKPIEIQISDEGADGVQVRVRDYGIGLGEDEAEAIFTPFYRSPLAKTKAHGIGLGLAVCKRIIEAQGGTIWATSREDGTDFVFRLPCEESDE